MPPLTRLFLKTGFVFLGLGAALSLAFSSDLIRPLIPVIGGMRAAQVHLITVGWLTNVIFGVAFWMFPRVSRERPFGNVMPARLSFWMLNIGLVIRVMAEPLFFVSGSGWWGVLLVAAGALQLAGALAFSIHIWPRIKGK